VWSALISKIFFFLFRNLELITVRIYYLECKRTYSLQTYRSYFIHFPITGPCLVGADRNSMKLTHQNANFTYCFSIFGKMFCELLKCWSWKKKCFLDIFEVWIKDLYWHNIKYNVIMCPTSGYIVALWECVKCIRGASFLKNVNSRWQFLCQSVISTHIKNIFFSFQKSGITVRTYYLECNGTYSLQTYQSYFVYFPITGPCFSV
jgi:hypothetical protein